MTTPNLFTRVEESLQKQTLMTTLGVRLARVALGQVELELPSAPHILQQHGFVHAGAITAVADSACGYACLTHMDPDDAVLSVEFKINLLAPAVGERFCAQARTLRVGRTIGVATAQVHAMNPGAEPVLIAVMQATMMRVPPRNGQRG